MSNLMLSALPGGEEGRSGHALAFDIMTVIIVVWSL